MATADDGFMTCGAPCSSSGMAALAALVKRQERRHLLGAWAQDEHVLFTLLYGLVNKDLLQDDSALPLPLQYDGCTQPRHWLDRLTVIDEQYCVNAWERLCRKHDLQRRDHVTLTCQVSVLGAKGSGVLLPIFMLPKRLRSARDLREALFALPFHEAAPKLAADGLPRPGRLHKLKMRCQRRLYAQDEVGWGERDEQEWALRVTLQVVLAPQEEGHAGEAMGRGSAMGQDSGVGEGQEGQKGHEGHEG